MGDNAMSWTDPRQGGSHFSLPQLQDKEFLDLTPTKGWQKSLWKIIPRLQPPSQTVPVPSFPNPSPRWREGALGWGPRTAPSVALVPQGQRGGDCHRGEGTPGHI